MWSVLLFSTTHFSKGKKSQRCAGQCYQSMLATECCSDCTRVCCSTDHVLCQVTIVSPSRGGNVAAYVYNKSQPSLPTPFYSVLVSVSVFMAISTVFHSINSPDNSAFSLCSSGLISALLALSTIDLFMKVFFSLDIILCA